MKTLKEKIFAYVKQYEDSHALEILQEQLQYQSLISKDDAVEIVQEYLLDFCGCGRPEENLRLIRNFLRHMKKRDDVFDDENDYTYEM